MLFFKLQDLPQEKTCLNSAKTVEESACHLNLTSALQEKLCSSTLLRCLDFSLSSQNYVKVKTYELRRRKKDKSSCKKSCKNNFIVSNQNTTPTDKIAFIFFNASGVIYESNKSEEGSRSERNT